MLERGRIDHLTAANGGHRRIGADDETILAMGDQRTVEVDLRQGAFPRFEQIPVEQGDHPHHPRGAEIKMHRVAKFEGPGRRREQRQADIEPFGLFENAGGADYRAAL